MSSRQYPPLRRTKKMPKGTDPARLSCENAMDDADMAMRMAVQAIDAGRFQEAAVHLMQAQSMIPKASSCLITKAEKSISGYGGRKTGRKTFKKGGRKQFRKTGKSKKSYK